MNVGTEPVDCFTYGNRTINAVAIALRLLERQKTQEKAQQEAAKKDILSSFQILE